MPTIVPPPPPGLQPPTQSPAPQAQAVNPGQTLAALPPGVTPGTAIEARIEAFLSRGALQVQTPNGTFPIQTAFPIPRAALILTLTLQTLAPTVLFQITAIDGKATPKSAAKGASPETTSAPPPRGVPSSPGAGLQRAGGAPGTGQPALAPSASGGGAASPAHLPAAIPGTLLGTHMLKAAATSASAPSPSAQTTAETGGKAAKGPAGPPAESLGKSLGKSLAKALANPLARSGLTKLSNVLSGTEQGHRTAPNGQGKAPSPSALRPGTFIGFKLLSVQSPANTASGAPLTPTSPSTASASASTLSATVTGQTTTGLPIVETRLGTLALMTKTPLEQGSKLILEMTNTPPKPAPGPEASGFWLREGLAQSKDGWPNLADALGALKTANPSIHQSVVQNALPAADNRLAANMLFFLSALRGGDVRGWIGQNAASLLQARAPDMLMRLGDDFQQLARSHDEPGSTDWRLAVLPFLNGGSIEPVRLFMRGRKKDDDGESEATRFVVDVDLSQIGKLQLDGLVRAERKHVDLIVRTERPLPDVMRQDISDIFREAGELTGLGGGLSFQASPPGFIDFTKGSQMPPDGAVIAPAASV